MANLSLILGNGKQKTVLVKGAGARSKSPANPPWAVWPSQCVGLELCCSPADPRGLAGVEWRLLLSLNLSAVSLFKASKREVKGLGGEDLQGMETLF